MLGSVGRILLRRTALAPFGLSPCRSQAKPLIDFRKEAKMSRKFDYEAWRPALLAFYWQDSPWMRQKLESLERGCPLTDYDKSVIDELTAQRVAA